MSSVNINRVVLAGNLTKDPESRQVGENTVVNASIAVNRRWKNKNGEQQEEVTFVDLEIWGPSADYTAKYLKKGAPVFIEGRLKLDKWDDKKTGDKRSALRVVVESLQSLATKPAGAAAAAADGEPAPARSSRRASSPAPAAGDGEPPF